MSNTRKVSITVELPGISFTLNGERGWGDNPRFYAQQIQEVLDGFKTDIYDIVGAVHGAQSAEKPVND